MAKYDDACIKDEFSRSSYGDQSDDDASAHDVPGNNVDVSVDSESGDFVLTIRSKTRSHLLDVLRQMYCNAISNEVFYKSAVNGRKIRESEYLKKCYGTYICVWSILFKVFTNPPSCLTLQRKPFA